MGVNSQVPGPPQAGWSGGRRKDAVAPGPGLAYTPRSRACRSPSAGPSCASPSMKPDTHPEYHEINVIMTDGTSFKTRSCYGNEGDTLRLDIDPKSHPAWTGQQRVIDTGGQIAKFNKKFAGIGVKKG